MTFQVAPDWFAFLFQLSGSVDLVANRDRPTVVEPRLIQASEGIVFGWDPAEKGRAIAFHFSREFLVRELGSFRPGLHEDLRAAIFEDQPLLGIETLSAADLGWVESLTLSPVQGVASSFWYRGKIQELLALHAFPTQRPEEEFFCSQQKRLAAERVEKVKGLLGQRIDEALDLKCLAREVGCSSAYLCRTFSGETGVTISRYLRSIRVERAAALLRAGKCNVSEAAIEVGYQSLSHFSKAFQQEKGCLPSRYLEAA